MDGRNGPAAAQLRDVDRREALLALQDVSARRGADRRLRGVGAVLQYPGFGRPQWGRHPAGPERSISPITFSRVRVAMNRLPLFVCCVVAVAGGYKKEATLTEALPNYAHSNWLNVVQNTMQLDVRIVDIISNASFMDADFRFAQLFPLNIEPGTRHFKVFLSSSVDTIAKRFILDTTYTFAEGQDYAFYLTGQARAGRPRPLRAMITNLALPSPGAGKIAIRVVNLAPSLGWALAGTLPDTNAAPDVHILASNGAPGTPSAASLAYGAASRYVVLDPGAYYVALTAPGTLAPKAVVGTVPPGTAANPATSTPAIAGSHIAGSVLTAIIVPHADTTSPAPKTRAGQGALQSTDTSVSEAARRFTLSGDTVTEIGRASCRERV